MEIAEISIAGQAKIHSANLLKEAGSVDLVESVVAGGVIGNVVETVNA